VTGAAPGGACGDTSSAPSRWSRADQDAGCPATSQVRDCGIGSRGRGDVHRDRDRVGHCPPIPCRRGCPATSHGLIHSTAITTRGTGFSHSSSASPPSPLPGSSHWDAERHSDKTWRGVRGNSSRQPAVSGLHIYWRSRTPWSLHAVNFSPTSLQAYSFSRGSGRLSDRVCRRSFRLDRVGRYRFGGDSSESTFPDCNQDAASPEMRRRAG
jgi:hypothetical protein